MRIASLVRAGRCGTSAWSNAAITVRRGRWISYPEQAHELAEAPAHCLQQTLMDLEKACRAHGPFRVRWRSARRRRPSFRFPEGNNMVIERLNRRHARVKLPKLGWVRFRLSRSLEGALIRSATVTREGRHWFISFLVDDAITTPTQHAAPHSAVGVDRGVVVAAASSDDCRALPCTPAIGSRRGRHSVPSERESDTAVRISAPRPLTSWPLVTRS